jgi:hypothetical protein
LTLEPPSSVARWRFSPPDLKVVWHAKNISGSLPISGGYQADLTNFVMFCIWLADSGGFGVSLSKKQLFFSLFLAKKNSG